RRLVVKHKGAVVADMPVTALSDAAPKYERPFAVRPAATGTPAFDAAKSLLPSLKQILGAPDMCSRRWVWEQYDTTVMADTVQQPGGDAAVVRVHGTNKGLAITTDVTPRYCFADPFEGAKQAVAEAWRNISAVGARPLAVTDNLNFGNPQKPEIMGEIVRGIDGIGEACRALDFPVIGGNCSLYNETNGEAILPTPAIGGVGLMKDVSRMATVAFKRAGEAIMLIGDTRGHLGQSIYLREVEGREEGAAPPVDLMAEKRTGDFVRKLIADGRVTTAHDVSDGGILVALAEMALAGDVGIDVGVAGTTVDAIPFFFGEDQARYVIAASPEEADKIEGELREAGIIHAIIGKTIAAKVLRVEREGEIALAELRAAHEGWFPRYMSGEEIPQTN
ncbi:MAG TPA: AIR synthase related protein, partial [Rhizomicrobium sp.]|nr:AIR synthase related protein [Rhizomicrobium sp.]